MLPLLEGTIYRHRDIKKQKIINTAHGGTQTRDLTSHAPYRCAATTALGTKTYATLAPMLRLLRMSLIPTDLNPATLQHHYLQRCTISSEAFDLGIIHYRFQKKFHSDGKRRMEKVLLFYLHQEI